MERPGPRAERSGLHVLINLRYNLGPETLTPAKSNRMVFVVATPALEFWKPVQVAPVEVVHHLDSGYLPSAAVAGSRWGLATPRDGKLVVHMDGGRASVVLNDDGSGVTTAVLGGPITYVATIELPIR